MHLLRFCASSHATTKRFRLNVMRLLFAWWCGKRKSFEKLLSVHSFLLIILMRNYMRMRVSESLCVYTWWCIMRVGTFVLHLFGGLQSFFLVEKLKATCKVPPFRDGKIQRVEESKKFICWYGELHCEPHLKYNVVECDANNLIKLVKFRSKNVITASSLRLSEQSERE